MTYKVGLTPQQIFTLTECRDVRSQFYSIRRMLAKVGDTLGDLSAQPGDEALRAFAGPLCDRVHAMESELGKASETLRDMQEKASKGT